MEKVMSKGFRSRAFNHNRKAAMKCKNFQRKNGLDLCISQEIICQFTKDFSECKSYEKTNLKYNNEICRCSSNHTHRSRGECNYCEELLLEKKAGEIRDFQFEKKFDLKIKDTHIANHYPDFFIIKKDGKTCIHEYKGKESDIWKIKQRLFKVCYPNIPYIVIPHRNVRRR